MGDTPIEGETATTQPLENKAEPATPLAEEKKPESEVETLRKRAEQAEMRANQLANEKKARDEADAKAQAKKLEEKEEFKTLYEQSQAKLEEIEREREAEEQRKVVTETRQSILSDYSDEVKEAAKDLGLSLDEVTDEAVTEYKAKLDKLQTRLGSQRVTPNNPGVPSTKTEYSGEELRQILNDPQKRDAYFRSRNGITAAMMKPQE